MWRPLSVKKNLGYDDSFSFLSSRSNKKKIQITFRDFRKGNVSIKSVDFISVLWGPRGRQLQSLPLKTYTQQLFKLVNGLVASNAASGAAAVRIFF
jgi:hypothetical protein